MIKMKAYIYQAFVIVFSILWLVSCAPQPVMNLVPKIELMVEMKETEYELKAVIQNELSGEYDVGFYYGLTEDDMTKISGKWDSSTGFYAHLSSLEYDTEYVYRAYVSNGRNEVCSAVESFRTQPEKKVLPLEMEFQILSAAVEMNECILKATICDELDIDGYEAGFYYGLTEDDMTKISGKWDSSTGFYAHLSSLEYDTEYVYKAYIGNGVDEICSYTESFGTESETGGNDSMTLPFHTVTVGTMKGEVVVDVGGEADFIISIPNPGSNWVTYEKDGRTCTFFISSNSELNDRECEVRFFNLVNVAVDILTIYQPAVSLTESNLPFDNYIEISSEKTELKMMLLEELYSGIRLLQDGNKGHEWMSLGSRSDWKYLDLFFEVDENLTTDERVGRWIITYDGFDSVLTIVQEGREEFFDFEDPVVGKACLEAFDSDGDSRLSFEELSRIPEDGLDVLDFSGSDISSFEEMRFFHTVTEINRPVFAGTKLKKVRLPKDLRTLEDGVFKNCSYLQDMEWEDLVYASVGKEVFMGCKSLVWVDTHIVGESAFENCTSLAGVTQRTSEVPPYAFRNCKSLGLFEFNVNADGRLLIGEEAFLGCVSLPEFTITEDITEIQDKAFYGCSSLSAVNMYPVNPPSLGEDVFTGASTDLKIYVPSQSVDLYKSSWPSLADRIFEGNF